MQLRWIKLTFLLWVFFIAGPVQGQISSGRPDAVPGEYIVRFKGSPSQAVVQGKILGKAQLKSYLGSTSMARIAMKSEHIADLQADPDVAYIEPNYYFSKGESAPLVPLSADEDRKQFSFSNSTLSTGSFTQNFAPVGVTQAWSAAKAYSSSSIALVAVIDTGLELNHSVITASEALWTNPGEVAGNGLDDDANGYVDDLHGWNFVADTPNPTDDEGHGTHVSGIVVGTSLDIFASPVAKSRIQIIPLKFLDNKGSGSTADAINAVYYAVRAGAKVINCSWGGGNYSQALHEALTYAYERGAIILAAAGNSGKNNDTVDMYPANYDVPSLITVAATYDNDKITSFSNYGATKVHVASPGYQIYSTYVQNDFILMSGTSMATPFVAGLAAMAQREAPSLTGYQLKQLILSSSDVVSSQLTEKVSSGARVNEYSLIQKAKAEANTSASQPTYSPSFKSERSPASEASSEGGGGKGGCGLVKDISGIPPMNGPMGLVGSLIALLLPIAVWMSLRSFMTSSDPKDKRKYERFKLESKIRVQVGDQELVADMRTISMGGASFCASTALSKGGVVTLKIETSEGTPIEVQGHVVWCESNKAYGVQFDHMKEAVREGLQGLTRNLAMKQQS